MAPTRYLNNNELRRLNDDISEQRLRRLLERNVWDKNIAAFIKDNPAVWCGWLYEKFRLNSEGVLLELIQCRPEVCLQYVEDHCVERLLMWLCRRDGSTLDKVIDLVATLHPSEILMEKPYYGSTGITCLHIAARDGCRYSDGKLRILLRHCSDPANAVLMRNGSDGTVLHEAASGAACLPALQTIVTTNPQVLRYPPGIDALWRAYSKTSTAPLTLASILEDSPVSEENALLFQQFWAKVEYLALKSFALFTTGPASVSLDPSSPSPNYVLHGLLLCNPPLPLVQFCLQYRPDTVNTSDRLGNMPLHIVVATCSPFSSRKECNVVAAVVHAAPSAARIRNLVRAIPLHLAIERKVPLEIVELLLAAAPETIAYCDIVQGLYPFQLAAIQTSYVAHSNVADINTIYCLLRQQPDLLHLERG